MSNLVPEKRLDVNGRLVTRHVKGSVATPLKKLPLGAPLMGGQPMAMITKGLSPLVSQMAMKQTFASASPRQKLICGNAMASSRNGAQLIAVAVERGNNAALAGTLGILGDDSVFASEMSPTKRYEKFLSAARDAHLIGGVGRQGESMNLAEARPEVRDKVREFVYLTDAAAVHGRKVTPELAELALRDDEHDFADVYAVVMSHGLTDPAEVRAMLED
jgi:hypothetical protein